MKKTLRKMAIVFAAALMVMMMAVPSFASTMTVNVHILTQQTSNTTIYDKWNQPYYITAKNVTVPVTYDTDTFQTVIPGANSTNHQYLGIPTVMDAIYSAYLADNGSNSGWQSYWDTAAGTNPFGCYVTKLYNNMECTQYLTSHKWKGYTWLIFKNLNENNPSFAKTWNSTTESGLIPQYASNILINDGDNVYIRYMYTEETF